MRAAAGVAIGVAALLHAAPARADGDMPGMVMSETSPYGLGASMLAASFSTPFYVGTYEGIVPTASWQHGRWSAMAMLGLYHVVENGLDVYGVGDVMVSGTATLVDAGDSSVGVTLAATLPTGSFESGLGMGNTMVMPALWALHRAGRLTLVASAGYTRGLADLAGHVHGLWPIVDPMNMQEVTWRATASAPVWRDLSLGIAASGGVPIAVPMGVDHASGAARVAWVRPRMVTAFELQAGLAGAPFTVRGVLETTVRF